MENKTMKHTPGPWKAGYWGDVVVDSFGVFIASLRAPKDEMSYEAERDANARLIAAAPELLDLLKRINWAFYVDGTTKAVKQVMAETKGIIAKAEGR